MSPLPSDCLPGLRALASRRLPVVHQLRQSVGLQRGMLVAGLVLTAVFLLVAVFAPLIAPYGYAQLRDADGTSARSSRRAAEHLLGTTVGGYDVLSRVDLGCPDRAVW